MAEGILEEFSGKIPLSALVEISQEKIHENISGGIPQRISGGTPEEFLWEFQSSVATLPTMPSIELYLLYKFNFSLAIIADCWSRTTKWDKSKHKHRMEQRFQRLDDPF